MGLSVNALSFGYSTSRPLDEPVPQSSPGWSGVGIVTTSNDASPAYFPINRPVRLNSKDPLFLANAGAGYLKDALLGLNSQLSGAGADVVAVRVAEGTSEVASTKLDQTFANILGDPGAKSGLWALRTAPAVCKMTPRLIMVPGYTSPRSNGTASPNPIIPALPEHLEALKAIAVVDVNTASKETAIDSREKVNSYRMLLVGVSCRVFENVDGAATLVTRSMSPRVIGRFVVTDYANEGKPFLPIANQPILGIADISRPIAYIMDDPSSEGQILLSNDVSIVVAGDTGDGAIADGGFTFIGVESAGTSDLWSQIHQVRGADYLDAKMAKITRQYLGGKITPRRAEAWLTALGFMLRSHVNDEDILGFKLDFPKVINSVEDVRLGELAIETNVEPSPVFRRARNTVRRYRPAVDALIDAIVARAGSISAVVS